MLLRGQVVTLLSSLRAFQTCESLLPNLQVCRCIQNSSKDVSDSAVQHSQSRSLAQPAYVEEDEGSNESPDDLKSTDIIPSTRYEVVLTLPERHRVHGLA